MLQVLFALALAASSARAVEIPAPPEAASIPLGPSECGLVTRYASHVIADGCLQEALNVTYDRDLGIQRRPGYANFNGTALSTPTAIRRLYQFSAPDGTHYVVAISSDKVWRATNSGNFTALTGTISPTEKTACTQVLGKLWCVNKIDGLFYWDGVVASTMGVSAGPLGGLIGNFRNRVLVADVASNQSRLYASGYLDGADWTTASQSTSPFIQPITGVNDGEKITCLMGTYGDTYIIGTSNRLFGLYGFDNNDFQVRELSREVGCLESTSVQEYDGSLVWLSRRGVERLRGTSIDWRVSEPIYDILQTIVGAAGNSVSATDTRQADFEAGNLTVSGPGAPLSATISVNNVVPTTWAVTTGGLNNDTWEMVDVDTTAVAIANYLDNFDDGDLTGNVTWTASAGSVAIVSNELVNSRSSAPLVSVASAATSAVASTGTWSWIVRSTSTLNTLWSVVKVSLDTTTLQTIQVNLSQDINDTSRVEFCVSVDVLNPVCKTTQVSLLTNGNYHSLRVSRAANGFTAVFLDGILVSSVTETGNLPGRHIKVEIGDSKTQHDSFRFPTFYELQQSVEYNTGLSTPTWRDYGVSVTSSSISSMTFFTQSATTAGGTYSTMVSQSLGVPITSPQRQYFKHSIRPGPPETISVASITVVNLSAATTGYFISQCRNPGTPITSWGLFQCSLTIPTNATLSLFVATGTTCNAVTRTTATWNSQVNNSVISIGTATFVAYRAFFDFQSATQAISGISLQDCSFNWNEGASRPETASAIVDHKYHLFYTTSTASGADNSHALVLDYRDRWALWNNMPAMSALTFTPAQRLIIGDGADNGQTYSLYAGYDDAGAAFTSRIRTKDFDAGNWLRRKELLGAKLEFSPLRDASDSVSMTIAAYVDKVTAVPLSLVYLNEDTGIVYGDVPAPLDGQVSGRYISLDILNTGTQHWKFYRGALQYRPLRED
ncbi:MAG: hypothetical protein QME60_01280 [Verrucomicrobiota bacterium]|nr:hypothetical protein [Verrucomicrobiota bacterium]